MRSRAVIQGRGDHNLPGWPAVGPKKKEEVRNAQEKAGQLCLAPLQVFTPLGATGGWNE